MNETSGCLDQSESTEKFFFSRDHFNMNKFGKREEEDFETICEVIERMVEQAPMLVVARDQGRSTFQRSRGIIKKLLAPFLPGTPRFSRADPFFLPLLLHHHLSSLFSYRGYSTHILHYCDLYHLHREPALHLGYI